MSNTNEFRDLVRAKVPKTHLCAEGCGTEILLRRKYCLDCSETIVAERKRESHRRKKAKSSEAVAS